MNYVDQVSDDSDLSDIDEAQFQDFDPANIAIEDRPAIAVDESNIGLIGIHKRKRPAAEGDDGGSKKKRERKREKTKKSRKARDDDDDDFSGGEEMTGKRKRRQRPVAGTAAEPKEARKSRKKPEINEEDLSPEEQRRLRLDRAMDEALRNPNRRRRKKTGVDVEKAQDDMIEKMRVKMVNAAMADNEARKAGRAAGAKLKMLPEVVSLLNRTHLQANLADPESGFVEAMKFFLEPLSDGNLPAYDVQREMFAALTRLPINQDTLVQSGIGKVMLFYTKSKRPEPRIKRIAEKLLGEWTRPILKRSANYSERVREEVDYDPSAAVVAPTDFYTKGIETQKIRTNPFHDPSRAQRPQPDAISYEIAPRNTAVDSKQVKRAGATGEAWLRKLKLRQANRLAGKEA